MISRTIETIAKAPAAPKLTLVNRAWARRSFSSWWAWLTTRPSALTSLSRWLAMGRPLAAARCDLLTAAVLRESEPELAQEAAERSAADYERLGVPHMAAKALARLAIFSAEDSVRAAAIEGLKLRRERDYTDILLQGFQYPLPAVANRAALAIIDLKRTELLPEIADVLGEAAPGDPAPAVVNDVAVHVVREVVRINHHRNCYLCHAPAENGLGSEVQGTVPSLGQPFPATTREFASR